MRKYLDDIFRENFIRILEEEGIKSSYQAQRKTGVSRRMIDYIKSGERSPSLSIIDKLADGLKRQPLEFLEDSDSN